jgi:MraZ protein
VALGARFFGKYEHALDAKGRLILPARLRGNFDRPGYLAPHLEGCLALWRSEEFDEEIATRLALAEGSVAERNAVREWSSAVFEVEIDRQGRMAIPTDLRDYAALRQEVLVVGMINRVELWSPERWELTVATSDTADAATPGA